MTTEEEAEPASRQEEMELSIISQSAQALAELVVRIGSHFRRAEVRKRLVRQFKRGSLHRSSCLSARRVDSGSGALPRGRHSRRGGVCDQRRASKAGARTSVCGGGTG